MSQPIDSKYSVMQNEADDTFAIMDIVTCRTLIENLKRHDLVKLMSDISTWLDHLEDEQ